MHLVLVPWESLDRPPISMAKVDGLKARPELNGKLGRTTSGATPEGRYQIRFEHDSAVHLAL